MVLDLDFSMPRILMAESFRAEEARESIMGDLISFLFFAFLPAWVACDGRICEHGWGDCIHPISRDTTLATVYPQGLATWEWATERSWQTVFLELKGR